VSVGPTGGHAFALEPERFRADGRADLHARSPKAPGPPLAGARREVITVLLVGVGYYVGTILGLQARFPGSGIALFWPPNAFLLAALLLAPMRTWWPCLLIVLPVHLHAVSVFQPGVPVVTMICQYAGNATQAVVAALAVRRFVGSPPLLDRLGNMASYIALAALFAPAAASSLVAGLFVLTGWVDNYWFTFRQRFLTNVVPNLTIPPLILMLASRRSVVPRRGSWPRYAEFAAVMGGLLVVQVAVFGEEAAGPHSSAALVYAPLPLLLWAAVRFGIGGMCLSLLIFAFLSLSAALAGRGPFMTRSPQENAVLLQMFLIASSVPLILLAALVEERRRSETDLRESQQRYGLATAAGGVGVWDWNLETNVVYVDPALKAMLGLEGDEIGDHVDDWRRLAPPEEFEQAQSLVRAMLAGKTDSFELECRAFHKDGSLRWFLARGVIERQAGRPARLVGTSTDITRRKGAEEQAQMRAEEVRALASQLAHLNRVVTVGELAAALAHEINQPLAGVLSNAQAALRLLSGTEPDWEEVRSALSDIVEDDHRAANVIDRMRALLRRETPSHLPLDMSVTVEGVVTLVHSDVLERGISLETRLGSGLPLVMGDRTQLQQVLLNLLLNAFDAVSEAHRAPPHVVLGVERADDRVVVSVVDNGAGVSDDQLPFLFQPFFTTKPTGIGLGLSICRTIVASHGGSLEARRNRDDVGMTFSFSLPGARDSECPGPPNSRLERTAGAGRSA
jgi:PAS domain S-box-containing protein